VAAILRTHFCAQKVVAFGSLVHPGRFTDQSDIDLAVSGIPPATFFPGLGHGRDGLFLRVGRGGPGRLLSGLTRPDRPRGSDAMIPRYRIFRERIEAELADVRRAADRPSGPMTQPGATASIRPST